MKPLQIILGILAVLIVTGFTGLGIYSANNHASGVKLRDVELTNTGAELKLEQAKSQKLYDLLNDKSVKSQDEINQYQKQIEESNKKTRELEKQLQAKAELKAKEQKAADTAVAAATLTKTASAANYPVSANAAKAYIYSHESGNNPAAVNSIGCRGIGQACPGSKLPCSNSDYACQDAFFTKYAMERYGSWEKAQQFWVANHWW